MKIQTNTTHVLTIDSSNENHWNYSITVDMDNTVQLVHGVEDGNKTKWLTREDLIALRSIITKALSLIP